MSLARGTRLGAYEIEAPLGEGGMGEVYRARDTRLKRDVAIKVLPSSFANDPERLARFEREAHVLAALNHPHIAHVYGFETQATETGGTSPALVMELVEGETLFERLAGASKSASSPGRLPIEEAREFARQIAEALGAAHERGIVHRDLKPANIKIRPDGTVKVLDFGLANWPADPNSGEVLNSPTITSPAMTRHGTILGTASYMAPEQAKGHPVDKRADIWAFGCVLFEMLTGRRLFDGESISEVIAAVIKDAPDWRPLPADTPGPVRRLLSRCLEKDPRRRLHDIADARFDLEEAIAAPGDGLPVATIERFRIRTREIVAWALALVLAVMVVWLATRFMTGSTPTAPARVSLIHRGTMMAGAPQISPDGRRVMYVARNQRGLWQLWVRDLDSGEPHPLVGTEDVNQLTMQPFWSWDSRSIGFFAQGKLRRISVSGGVVQTVADAGLGRGLAWSSDGTILYAPEDIGGLFRVSADGGSSTPVTHVPKEGLWTHFWPSLLPDGRRFLFTAKAWNRPFDESEAGIFLGSLDSQEAVRLLPDVSNAVYSEAGYILFARDGVLTAVPFDAVKGRITGDAISLGERVTVNASSHLAAFSVSRDNVLALRHSTAFEDAGQLRWIDRDGKVIADVGGVRNYLERAVSADGRSVAATITDPRTGSADIWILRSDGTERQLTSSREYEGMPVWSPDGSRIAYLSTSNRASVLHVRDVNGGEPTVLSEWREGGVPLPQAWSPDGRHLLINRVAILGRPPDLFTFSFESKAASPYLDSAALETLGMFSPDGRFVLYVSNEAGPIETWIARFPSPGGEKWRIATNANPVSWRADSREILIATGGGDIMAIPVSIAGDRVVTGTPTVLVRRLDDLVPNTTRDHSRLLVLSRPDPEQGVAEVRLVTGWQEKLR